MNLFSSSPTSTTARRAANRRNRCHLAQQQHGFEASGVAVGHWDRGQLRSMAFRTSTALQSQLCPSKQFD
jgi:hypothetical protein